MKIRQGHVSNSSSSSYIVHSSAIGKDNFNKLISFLQEYVKTHSTEGDWMYWGESYKTFEVQDQYLLVELFHAPEEVYKTFRKYVDNSNKAFYIDG